MQCWFQNLCWAGALLALLLAPARLTAQEPQGAQPRRRLAAAAEGLSYTCQVTKTPVGGITTW